MNTLVENLSRPNDVRVADEYFTMPRVEKGVRRDLLDTLAEHLAAFHAAHAENRAAEEKLKEAGIDRLLR